MAENLRNVGGTSGAEQVDPSNGSCGGTLDNCRLFPLHSFRIRHLRCLPHPGVSAILTVPARPYRVSWREPMNDPAQIVSLHRMEGNQNRQGVLSQQVEKGHCSERDKESQGQVGTRLLEGLEFTVIE